MNHPPTDGVRITILAGAKLVAERITTTGDSWLQFEDQSGAAGFVVIPRNLEFAIETPLEVTRPAPADALTEFPS